MPQLEKPVKLKRGKIAEISRRLKLNPTHVYLVGKGAREGRDELIAALRDEEEKESQDTAA